MRLIDADALKNKLNFVYDCAYIGSKSKEGIASDIIDEIDNAETYNQVGHKMATAEGFCTNPEWYKGGLISRSALLKTFSNSRRFKETTSGLYVMEMLEIKEVIDNAPTVPNEYMRGYEAAEREYKRPQGEWVIIDDTVCECPRCKHQQTFLLSPKESNVNFCEKCGADMRGEGK